MYQRGRNEALTDKPMSTGSPSTDVPQCPPSLIGEEHKREAEGDLSEMALKRARNASSIPVPDSDEDLFVDDAFIVEMEAGTLPKGWRLIDGEFETG